MSSLDVPRIHFGGLFYAAPSTINNTDGNYTIAEVADVFPQPGWNPTGVAYFWLSQCMVLSAVGAGGPPVSGDPIVGALVETPSQPPQSMPDGITYDVAKLVDLDPDQQGRSAIYGLRIYVTLPGGGYFSGLMSVPELQAVGNRVVGG